MSRRKTPKAEVKAFRERYGLTQSDLDLLLGFTSGGLAVARWEREDAPYYVTLLFAMVDAHGIDLLRSFNGVGFTSRDLVQAFRTKHGLRGTDLDRLFGFNPTGRATRRWEDPSERGAPSYVTILMAYADKHGLGTLQALASEPA